MIIRGDNVVNIIISNLFESKAQTLVNTVNCVGVMGKGIALEFKNRFPEMNRDYVKRCNNKSVKLGKPYLFKAQDGTWILNFPTKNHWRSVTSLNDIIDGMKYMLDNYNKWGVTSLAVPPLGCGYGQLEWRVVGPTLYHYLNKFQIPVELYAPYGTPHNELQPDFLQQELHIVRDTIKMPEPKWIKPGWVALVGILKRIEEQPYHWPVGRTIFQKIAYVSTEKGLPTNLTFHKRSFGPFSPDLKQVITKLLNNGLISEEKFGSMFKVKVGPTYGAAMKAYSEYLKNWDPIITETADLFMRINTTRQAELVTSVLFAAKKVQERTTDIISEQDVVQEIMTWKHRRRPPLNEEIVASAVRNLASLKWLNVKASKDLNVIPYIP